MPHNESNPDRSAGLPGMPAAARTVLAQMLAAQEELMSAVTAAAEPGATAVRSAFEGAKEAIGSGPLLPIGRLLEAQFNLTQQLLETQFNLAKTMLEVETAMAKLVLDSFDESPAPDAESEVAAAPRIDVDLTKTEDPAKTPAQTGSARRSAN